MAAGFVRSARSSYSRGRLVGQGNRGVDDDFTMGGIRHTSSGPDSVILRVERYEDAFDPLDRDGPVVSPPDDMDVTIGHALEVPARSVVQTLGVDRLLSGGKSISVTLMMFGLLELDARS